MSPEAGAKCDFCDKPAVSLTGEANGVLACAEHVAVDETAPRLVDACACGDPREHGPHEADEAVGALARWLRSQVMGAEFCAHHPWGRGDQDYWRKRATSIPLTTAEVTESEVEAAARALYLEDQNASDGFDVWLSWDHDDNVAKPSYRDNARAALEAARSAREEACRG